jgi:hypothetical protein
MAFMEPKFTFFVTKTKIADKGPSRAKAEFRSSKGLDPWLGITTSAL